MKRRNPLFESSFLKKTTGSLDISIKSFFLEVRIFDEVLIIKKSYDNLFSHLYDYSLRSMNLPPINMLDLENLVEKMDAITILEVEVLPSEVGSSFDLVAKIGSDIYVLINNTEYSLEQLEEKWGCELLMTVKHILVDFINKLVQIVKDDVI